ncbi:hypothetical protein LOK49_LG10G02025 [Camellia lanceoleosa]|uniref:Uncharacterized protein n=1 Tax=Camellia lanceoleosa TaxID=1840588 RepID=A0ACC0G513_9ERIC|nr:hypothetical protein LOK49_LG10G02025 [Camellia lanceoleosa]
MTLRYGYYGNYQMVLGSSSSRLFEASSIFVKQVEMRDGGRKGVNCVDYFTGGYKPYLITGSDDQTAKFGYGMQQHIGCGADELIDLIMHCVLDPGDKIVDCPPTFTMYEFDVAINRALVIKVPRKPDFSLDVELITEESDLSREG